MQNLDITVASYGSNLKASVMADIAEYAAIKHGDMFVSSLDGAFAEDVYIDALDDEDTPPDRSALMSLSEQTDLRSEILDGVTDVIAERVRNLKDHYCFTFDEKRKRLTFAPDRSKNYAVLLALLLSHAHDHRAEFSPLRAKPSDAFELIVERAMQQAGFEAERIGANRGRLQQTLKPALTRLSLSSIADGLVSIASSWNDAGVDVLSRFPWGNDKRGGQWVFCVQATCGKYSEWPKKMREPNIWHDVFSPWSYPVFALAIPHHAPERILPQLWGSGHRNIQFLDRLRLVPYLQFELVEIESAMRWIKDETALDWLISG